MKDTIPASSRLLHRIAMSRPVAKLSRVLERRFAPADSSAARDGAHVFVSGLSSSGASALTQRLHASGAFCTLSNRSKPFVLAPNLWSKKQASDADSPESLDEAFWRVTDPKGYIRADHLAPHEPDEAALNGFTEYVAGILRADPQGRIRYLSNANNAILRLPALRRAFPRATLLVPFREPLAHAASLMRQHTECCAQQRRDPFMRSEMGRLGQFEFGLDHRPFRFSAEGAERLASLSPETLDYWLEIWCQSYAWLEASAPSDATFICSESLCDDPSVWASLAAQCGIEVGTGDAAAFERGRGAEAAISGPQIEDAQALYWRLVERAQAAIDQPYELTERYLEAG